jgi:hypothetical protein
MKLEQAYQVLKKQSYTPRELVDLGAFPSRYYVIMAVKKGQLRCKMNGKLMRISRYAIIDYLSHLQNPKNVPAFNTKNETAEVPEALETKQPKLYRHEPEPVGFFTRLKQFFFSTPREVAHV